MQTDIEKKNQTKKLNIMKQKKETLRYSIRLNNYDTYRLLR